MAKAFQSVLFVIGLVVVSPTAIHAADDYRCTITRVSLADADSGPRFEELKKTYVGKQFTVERSSGVMAGTLKNSYVTKPQVIDSGSSQNSYKVITTMKKEQGAGWGSNIYALNILEYERASRKPFVFLSNEEVFFGHCEAF